MTERDAAEEMQWAIETVTPHRMVADEDKAGEDATRTVLALPDEAGGFFARDRIAQNNTKNTEGLLSGWRLVWLKTPALEADGRLHFRYFWEECPLDDYERWRKTDMLRIFSPEYYIR